LGKLQISETGEKTIASPYNCKKKPRRDSSSQVHNGGSFASFSTGWERKKGGPPGSKHALENVPPFRILRKTRSISNTTNLYVEKLVGMIEEPLPVEGNTKERRLRQGRRTKRATERDERLVVNSTEKKESRDPGQQKKTRLTYSHRRVGIEGGRWGLSRIP